MKPGDLVKVVEAPDQSKHIRHMAGEYGIVIKNLGEKDGTYSPNIWEVHLSSDRSVSFHILDLEVVSGQK